MGDFKVQQKATEIGKYFCLPILSPTIDKAESHVYVWRHRCRFDSKTVHSAQAALFMAFRRQTSLAFCHRLKQHVCNIIHKSFRKQIYMKPIAAFQCSSCYFWLRARKMTIHWAAVRQVNFERLLLTLE